MTDRYLDIFVRRPDVSGAVAAIRASTMKFSDGTDLVTDHDLPGDSHKKRGLVVFGQGIFASDDDAMAMMMVDEHAIALDTGKFLLYGNFNFTASPTGTVSANGAKVYKFFLKAEGMVRYEEKY